MDIVSIPKRVSAKVEHQQRQVYPIQCQVSIPKRVSAKVEPSGTREYLQINQFQSLKGFQPK